MAAAELSIPRYPCPGCGAMLVFNPQRGGLKCEYCGQEREVPDSREIVAENDYNRYLAIQPHHLSRLSPTAVEISCQSCGAAINFEPPKIAGQCPFCAASIVAQPKLANPILAPAGIVPFTVGKKAARNNLLKWLQGNWFDIKRYFAPNSLSQLAQAEKLQGIYLPFWTYDAQTTSHYRGKRGDNYTTTETRTVTNTEGKTETETYEVEHTSWTPVAGCVKLFLDDVLVAATTLVDGKRLKALEPWNIPASLRPYDPSYLAGFEAQRSQVSLQQGFETAKQEIKEKINIKIRRYIGGDKQQIDSVSTEYEDITFKSILLPVWLTSYRYRNRQYQVMINALTGEVQGEYPLSIWKITLAIMTGLLILVIIILSR